MPKTHIGTLNTVNITYKRYKLCSVTGHVYVHIVPVHGFLVFYMAKNCTKARFINT